MKSQTLIFFCSIYHQCLTRQASEKIFRTQTGSHKPAETQSAPSKLPIISQKQNQFKKYSYNAIKIKDSM